MRRRLLCTALAIALLGALAASAVRPPAAEAKLPTFWGKGVNVTAFWWQDLSGPAFKRWLRLARTSAHANSVTFVVSWYQYYSDVRRTDALNADEIHFSGGSARRCKGQDGTDYRSCKTPSLGALGVAIERARALGLRVVLRPQVDVGRSSKQSTQRSFIDRGPTTRAAWFRAYSFFLSQYARLARDHHVDELVVGSDFSRMTDTPDDRAAWVALIKGVRSGTLMGDGKGGYDGMLTYAAEWDSIVQDALDPATHLFFWDQLDEIGIDGYFPLVPAGSQGNPSVDVLKAGWATDFGSGLPSSPVDLVRRLHEEYGKNVRFTALGYLSRNGTAAYPEKSDYDLKKAGGTVAQLPQERGMRAAFQVWGDIATREHWFRGIDWWEWPASGRGGPKDGSFSLEGKKAQAELCRQQGGSRCGVTTGL